MKSGPINSYGTKIWCSLTAAVSYYLGPLQQINLNRIPESRQVRKGVHDSNCIASSHDHVTVKFTLMSDCFQFPQRTTKSEINNLQNKFKQNCLSRPDRMSHNYVPITRSNRCTFWKGLKQETYHTHRGMRPVVYGTLH